MTLFDDDSGAAMLAGIGSDPALIDSIREAYREKLLLNPPTPSFNRDKNGDKAEAFARFAAAKDITRFLAVLDETGLTISKKEQDERNTHEH